MIVHGILVERVAEWFFIKPQQGLRRVAFGIFRGDQQFLAAIKEMTNGKNTTD